MEKLSSFKANKLAEEELIFQNQIPIQNIKYLKEDIENLKEPKSFVYKDYQIILLNRSTVTSVVASFKEVSFRLFANKYEKVLMFSPIAPYHQNLDLEDYCRKATDYIADYFEGLDKGVKYDTGDKITEPIKKFQLWNFYNYKVYISA